MNLAELQKNFQSYLLQNNTEVVQQILSSENLSPTQHLQIYQNSYLERIIAAMQQDFPIILSIVGESAFSSLVHDYINHYPSKNFNLRYVGKYLSEFILQRDASLQAFSDLAKSEYLKID